MRNLAAFLLLLLTGLPALSQATDASGASGDFLDVGGPKLWYEECSAADSPEIGVVLLHDGLVHSITWDGVWAALCSKYRVVRYDRRGYGRSEPTKTPFVPEDDLYKIMRQVHMQRAILVGNSSGGGLALDFAVAHPEMTAGLFLIGPVVHGMPTTALTTKRGADNSAPLEHGDSRSAAENWSKDRFLIAGDDPRARKLLLDALLKNPQNLTVANGLEVRPSPPTVTRLSQIRVPALVVAGDADIPDVFMYSGAIVAALPFAAIDLWKDTGHLIQIQRPDDLVARFNRFFTLAVRKEIALSESQLSSFAGEYSCFDHAAGVALKEGRLVFEFPGDPYKWLFAASESRFFLRTSAAEIEFQKDSTGKVSKMVIHNSDGSQIACPHL